MPTGEAQALSDVKVLDLTRFPPGAYCTVLLADLGADVVRIDSPGANTMFFGVGTGIGRGKRSIAIDLRHPDAGDVLRRLVAWADVVVDNARPGTLDERGYGPNRATEDHPSLVWCSITGYGQDGPYADWAGHDLTYLAHSGMLAGINPALPWHPASGARGADRRAHGGSGDHRGLVRPRAHRTRGTPRHQPGGVDDLAAQRQRGAPDGLGLRHSDLTGAPPVPVQRPTLDHHRGGRATDVDRVVHCARPRRSRGGGATLGRRRGGGTRPHRDRVRHASRGRVGRRARAVQASRSASCTRARRWSTTPRCAHDTPSSRWQASPCPRTRSASAAPTGCARRPRPRRLRPRAPTPMPSSVKRGTRQPTSRPCTRRDSSGTRTDVHRSTVARA